MCPHTRKLSVTTKTSSCSDYKTSCSVCDTTPSLEGSGQRGKKNIKKWFVLLWVCRVRKFFVGGVMFNTCELWSRKGGQFFLHWWVLSQLEGNRWSRRDDPKNSHTVMFPPLVQTRWRKFIHLACTTLVHENERTSRGTWVQRTKLQAFLGVLIDLIIELLDLIIKSLDNQTEIWTWLSSPLIVKSFEIFAW